MHPDEANQAWKTGLLWQTGQYRYDPAEHHGPTLYYLTLPVLWLAGAGDFAQTTETHYRLVTALAGVGLVLAVGLLRKALGSGPVLAAAALTALSPVMVFYSRYYIQEILLVLFTLGLLGSVARGRQSNTLAGAAGWAAIGGGCLGLMAATKETWVLALAAMVAAGLLALLWASWLGHTKPRVAFIPFKPGQQSTMVRFAWPKWGLLGGLSLLAASGVVWALYTGMGAQPEGLWDALGAYRIYLQRGMETKVHRHGPLFYLERLLAYRAKGAFWTEGLILLLAAVGMLGAFWPRKRPHPLAAPEVKSAPGTKDQSNDPTLRKFLPEGVPTANADTATGCGSAVFGAMARTESADIGFVRFLAFYTVSLTVLYSAIPYKTPWCALSFWHGWILLAGVGGGWSISRLAGLANRLLAWVGVAAAGVVLGLGLGHLAWQSWQLNFNGRLVADGERNPWVYAHTAPHILRLAERLEQLAGLAPEGHRMTVHVIIPDNYWPLPWYLRRFDQERVGYWDRVEAWAEMLDRVPPPQVLILQAELADQMEPFLTAAYNQQMLFRLRPEVFLRVYVRQDLWEAFVKSVCPAS